MKRQNPETESRLRGPVFLFFLLSGATSLILQVVWTRMLTTVFGATVLAASAVLTSFMLGLALGSAWLGRAADRHPRGLRLYGLLEVGIGVYALGFPWLVEATGLLYAWVYRTYAPGVVSSNAFRLAMSMGLLLPPTILMGGTLPVLGRYLGLARAEPGREVGLLYAANTFGGVVGSFLAGFWLMERFGVPGTLRAAGVAALGIGALAWGLGRRPLGAPVGPVAPVAASAKPRRVPLARGPGAAEPGGSFAFLCVVFGVTGFCALAYEVLWTRILIFLLGTTVHAFATMLTTFLVGHALGAFGSARWIVPRLTRPFLAFGFAQILVGLAALASVPLLAALPGIETRFMQTWRLAGDAQYAAHYFADAALVMGVPTLLMGAAFPMLLAACTREGATLGRRVGAVYAANTLGCVLGSLAAGFVLLPWLGTRHSLLAVVWINLLAGAAVFWRVAPRPRSLPSRLALATPAVGLVAWFAIPTDVFLGTINASRAPSRLVFVEESPAGTVTVHDLPNGERLIAVDGVDVAGRDYMLRTTQKLQGYLPLLLHPQPRKVVQIGFGSGETTRVGLDFGVEDYTVIELCPAVFRAGPLFEELNHGSYRDARVRRVIMDGKNFARLSGERFDVIMNDSIFPGSSGSSALYGLDHFRACRARLADGGLFSCWVPLDLRPSEMRMILRSFLEVFPEASLWMASNCLNKHAVIVGTASPLRLDFQRLRDALQRPALQADLEPIALASVCDLLDCHMLDAPALGRLVKDAPITSDDWPRLEFSCARRSSWQSRLLGDLAMLTAHRAPVLPYVTNFADAATDGAELTRRFEATTHLFRAQVAQLAGQPKARRQGLDAAWAANPGEVHVRTCEEELNREIRDLEGMVRLYPGQAVYRERLAEKLFLGLRFAEAEQLYLSLLGRSASLASDAYVHLAEIQFHFGRAAEAERTLLVCLEVWPRAAVAHDRLAGIYLQMGRLDAARAHIARALQIAPDHPEFRHHQARILARP